jgi:uncharacterized membrane protein YraQ (UPF0718 family)
MYFLLAITFLALIVSFFFDRAKTYLGLKKGLAMFAGILPALFNILILVSIVMFLIPQNTIAHWLGRGSGVTGMTIAALAGSVSLIPGFIAFPLGAILLKSGVSYGVLAVFLTTLMMVGIVTLPLEAKYFGWKPALVRNGLSFLGALLIGAAIGWLM